MVPEKVVKFAINSKLDTKPNPMKTKILAVTPKVTCVLVAFIIMIGVAKAIGLAYVAIVPKPDVLYTPLWWLWYTIGMVTTVPAVWSFFYSASWLMDRSFWHRFDNRYGTAA